jgi:hypothetical protein
MRAEARRRLERANLEESRRHLVEESARQLQRIEEEKRALEARQREQASRAKLNYYRRYSYIYYKSPAGPYTRCSKCSYLLQWGTKYYHK